MSDYLHSPNPNVEPISKHGQLYLIQPGGAFGPVTGLPQTAVVGDTLTLGVEGIDGKCSAYARMYRDFKQPVLMVHEGIEADHDIAVRRIENDMRAVKAFERGEHPAPDPLLAADPAVKSTWTLLQAALDRHLHVLLVLHSGGGAEAALAMHLLPPSYQSQLQGHVRIVSLAGAASPQDYPNIKPDDILYAGDPDDSIAQAGSAYIDPQQPEPGLKRLVDAVLANAADLHKSQAHEPYVILPERKDRIAAFMAGAPGGVFLH